MCMIEPYSPIYSQKSERRDEMLSKLNLDAVEVKM
jgi:hypothetical protein